LTVRCIEALKGERNKLPSLRVIVVDGASGDNSAADIRAFVNQPAWIHWVSFVPLEVNGGFGWANNQAILHLAGSDRPPQFIHLLNPDTEICPGAVVQLANYLEAHSRTAAAGSQLINVDGSLAGSAFSFPTVRGEFSRGASTGFLAKLLRVPPIAIEAPRAREVDWVTG
jgi:GT2 family glycosyltransferase